MNLKTTSADIQKPTVIAGTVCAACAVLLGAFGAHALKARLDSDHLQVFETGVRYQMTHAIALILLGISYDKMNARFAKISARLFLAGIIFFSGSLYLLACQSLAGIENWKFLGPITPLGGLCFIAGWSAMLYAFIKNNHE